MSVAQADDLLLPTKRSFKFHLPHDRINDWLPSRLGLHCTAYFNALSIFFPPGESFFIRSVQRHKSHPAVLNNPQLTAAVAGFVGQEAIHSREHEEYNEAINGAGHPAAAFQSFIDGMLHFLEGIFPASACLAGTVGLEHMTSTMGDALLRDDKTDHCMFEGAEPHYAALWRWHALEEVEHKHVAFEVYEAVYGKGWGAYIGRLFYFLFANAIFWPLCIAMHIYFVYSAGGLLALLSPIGWLRVFDLLWGWHGALRRSVRAWCEFFAPSFHPWRYPGHNNAHFLARIPELEATVAAFAKGGDVSPPQVATDAGSSWTGGAARSKKAD